MRLFCGFNITVLVGLFTRVFARLFGRWRGAVSNTLYTLMVGAAAAAVRAAIMGILSVFARQFGHRQDVVNNPALVSALTVPDGRLHITLLVTNSGGLSGEAILVRTPAGHFILINGGSSTSQLSESLGRRLLTNIFIGLIVALAAIVLAIILPQML